jgi:hypothetical protein
MTPQSDRQHPNNDNDNDDDDDNDNNHDNNTEISSLQTPTTHPELNQSLPETVGTETEGDALLQRPTDQIGYPMLATQDPFCQQGNFCFPFPFGPKMSMAEMLSSLPSNASGDYLITQYFLRVSPFFHVLHGPTFQKQYQAFVRDPSSVDFSWLGLLFIMHSITINTMEDNDPILTEILSIMPQASHASAVSYHYRVMAMLCLCRDNFMVHHRLSTLEALLILAYSISHNESVEGSWTLLGKSCLSLDINICLTLKGIALNISIALRCNATRPSPELNCIDVERRRRCWAGILMLHTYQAILFRDVDMSVLNIKAVMPADVDDADILEDKILDPSRQPTQMSAIRLKIQLFQLSTHICQELQDASGFSQARLEVLDAQVSAEQHHWDSIFLVDGCPSLLDTSSYAHWCVLQLYAHQLFLLLHRPFSRADAGPRYSSASRAKCIASSAALLDIHRQLFELPRLRHYRWYSGGMSCFCALHGAVTLASCLLQNTDEELDATPYRAMFDKAVVRIHMLQDRSPICVKAYPVLQRLQ